MNQEVTTKKENALAVNMFEADADKGSQNMTQDDLALPFVRILGQLSPQVTAGDSKYICLLYTSPSPRDVEESRMPSSA